MTETTSQPPQNPPPSPPPGGTTDTFDRLRGLGVARPAHGRWIGGVAAGLARRWNLDPLLVRGVFVALAIASGIGLLIYGVAWALLPEEDGRIHLQRATRGDVTAGLVGAGVLTLMFLIFAGDGHHGPGPGGLWWGFPGVVLGGLIGLAVWWWASREERRSGRPPGTPPGTPSGAGPAYGGPTAPYGSPSYGATPYTSAPYGSAAAPATAYAPTSGQPGAPVPAMPPAPPVYGAPGSVAPPPPPPPPRRDRPSRRTTRLTLGLAVLAAVAVAIADRVAGPLEGGVAVLAMAAALAVLATGVIVTGVRGRKSGGLAPIGIVLAVALIIGSAASHGDLRASDNLSLLGDRDWRPTTLQEADRDVNLGFGDATLWLTDPAIASALTAADPLRLRAQVGAGTLTLVVPDDTPVEFRAELGGGQLVRPDGSTRRFDDGPGDDSPEIFRTGPAGPPEMIIDARVGFGEILVQTATPTSVTTPEPARTGPSPAPSIVPSGQPSTLPTPPSRAVPPTP